MPDLITKSSARIRQAIDLLTVNRTPVRVKIEGEQTFFDSIILKAEHGQPSLKTGTAGRVFVQWLIPPEGNDLIQSANPVQIKFSFGKYSLAFTSYYVTRSLKHPYFGHILTYPESLVVADRRKHDRHEVDSKASPLFAKAKISMRGGRIQKEAYDLEIFDISENGVGLLGGEELSDWLEQIGVGERLNEVELCAPWTIMRVGGTVRHKSMMRNGKYSGYHLLGVELDETLEPYA